jgi:hypothetical protein
MSDTGCEFDFSDRKGREDCAEAITKAVMGQILEGIGMMTSVGRNQIIAALDHCYAQGKADGIMVAHGERFKCRNNESTNSEPDDPCDWPHCSCDPVAERVVDALSEQGVFYREEPKELPQAEFCPESRQKCTYPHCGCVDADDKRCPAHPLTANYQTKEAEA